ncbi:hypothetical protein B5M09_005273, partial [Aphanomyces astaci]
MSRRSSRASGSGGRSDALNEIRRLREAKLNGRDEDDDGAGVKKVSRIETYNAKEGSIYQELNEDEYNDLVRKRREELPFVEDDEGGMGYYDDGEEQYFEDDGDLDEEVVDPDDDVDPNNKKRQSSGALSSAYVKRAKRNQRAKLGTGTDQKITHMFFSKSSEKPRSAPAAAASSRHAKQGTPYHTPDELYLYFLTCLFHFLDIDLDSMLDDLTSNPLDASLSRARKPPVFPSSRSATSSQHVSSSDRQFMQEYRPSATTTTERDDTDDVQDGVDNGYEFDDDAAVAPVDPSNDGNVSSPLAAPPTQDVAAVAQPFVSKRDLLLKKARESRVEASAATERALNSSSVPFVGEKPVDDVVDSVPSNQVGEWWNPTNDAEVDTIDTSTAADGEAPALNDDLQLFWTDAVEVRDRPGKLYLIGKTKDAQGGGFKSCCVIVNNLQRYLYVVPRVPDQHKDTYSTMGDMPKDIQQQLWMNMHKDISSLLIPSCITDRKDQQTFRTKLVDRNYAFDLPDLPRGKNTYLKVKYPARYAAPHADVCAKGGPSFVRICGASVRPLETFLIRRKLLGPGWLRISGAQRVTTNHQSYCKVEYETASPVHVVPIHGIPSPPLTVLSLSIKTCCNPHSHKHEVVAFSAVTETNINPEGGSKGKGKISHFSGIRPFLADGHQRFPESYGPNALANDRFRAPQSLSIEMNEKALLNFLLARVQREDPDVIVGHNLQGYTLDVLMSRMDNFKMGGMWSRLTRLRRGLLAPLNQGEGWNEYRLDDMSNGRLFCDTFVSAKELLTSQSTYSLSHLVSTQLQKTRVEVESTDIPAILSSGPDNFVKFIHHTLDDAMFVLHLMHKLEVIPLTKQLANLCGYLWTRTLQANKRAERIEYLLLHEFDRSKHKFIVPEKFRDSKQSSKSVGKKKREPAGYAGGMVFAPKKGLYDNFVVLLDFNSLYPSIIREYNICFTTVERSTLNATKDAGPARRKTNLDDDDDDEDVDEVLVKAESDVPALPSSSCAEGVLPQVIKRLLESRKLVKQQLKAELKAGNIEKSQTLDIRQKAIKLTANSMYGCLGFRYSRFYARPIAALITSTGRQTLQRAQEVAEQECGYDVIYGDTDSIMVDSRSDQLEHAKRIGREIQIQCNKHFKLLELEVDYIFKTILLLNKKKYASLVVKETNDGTYEKEVKGLDMVRRDWCVLSKVVGNVVLDLILSGIGRDEVVEKIHEHLQTIHPPVNRLCAHIDGTSSPQLAQCLGLDTSKFSHSVQNVGDDEVDVIPSVLQHDSDRFKSCTPLRLTCLKCGQENAFEGVYASRASRYSSGLLCPNAACSAIFWGYDQRGLYGQVGDDFASLVSNRMHLAIRDCTRRYYQGWVVCTEGLCSSRTQKQSLRGRRGDACSVTGCRGTVCMEYSDSALYTQLKYYESLVDVNHALDNIQKENARQPGQEITVGALSDSHRDLFAKLCVQIRE